MLTVERRCGLIAGALGVRSPKSSLLAKVDSDGELQVEKA
jgi:hypothetical protein